MNFPIILLVVALFCLRFLSSLAELDARPLKKAKIEQDGEPSVDAKVSLFLCKKRDRVRGHQDFYQAKTSRQNLYSHYTQQKRDFIVILEGYLQLASTKL